MDTFEAKIPPKVSAMLNFSLLMDIKQSHERGRFMHCGLPAEIRIFRDALCFYFRERLHFQNHACQQIFKTSKL